MRAHLRYLRYVIRHKWFVLVAGLRVRAPLWRLLIHDWSKFTPSEWGPYAASFYGGWKYDERPPEVVAAFDAAWLHHQKRNRHHWQYWVLMEDQPSEGHYPRWHIVSADGGLVHHAMCEYTRPYDSDPIHVHFANDQLVNDGSVETDARYRMLLRLTRAANRSRPLPMPNVFAREMVADWMGAGRAITGRWEVREWYDKNRENIVLHPETRALVESLLLAGRTDGGRGV